MDRLQIDVSYIGCWDLWIIRHTWRLQRWKVNQSVPRRKILAGSWWTIRKKDRSHREMIYFTRASCTLPYLCNSSLLKRARSQSIVKCGGNIPLSVYQAFRKPKTWENWFGICFNSWAKRWSVLTGPRSGVPLNFWIGTNFVQLRAHSIIFGNVKSQ